MSVPVGGWQEGALQGGISRGKQWIAGVGRSAGKIFSTPQQSQDGHPLLCVGASLPVGLGQLMSQME